MLNFGLLLLATLSLLSPTFAGSLFVGKESNAIAFDTLTPEQCEKEYESAKLRLRKIVKAIGKSQDSPTFENTILPLENISVNLELPYSLIYQLDLVLGHPGWKALHKKLVEDFAILSNEITFDRALFERIKILHLQKGHTLTPEQKRVVELKYKEALEQGVELPLAAQERIMAIDKELSLLSVRFKENALNSKEAFELHTEDAEAVKDIPQYILSEASSLAIKKGKSGWIFSLHDHVYRPFLTYCKDSKLREQYYKAYTRIGYKGEFDNSEIAKSIATLRKERAQILGFESYAELVISSRMAKSEANVRAFVTGLLEASVPAARTDFADVQAFARDTDGVESLRRWDISHYTEKLRNARYDFDPELLKPYFSLPTVYSGFENILQRLPGFQLTLEKLDIPTFHPDVSAYAVRKKDGTRLGIVYVDPYARAGKVSGAWKLTLRPGYKSGPNRPMPIVSITFNFPPPQGSNPTLLSIVNVTTFFHEWGHALHELMSQAETPSVAGTRVQRDFVEYPSQLLETFGSEPSALRQFGRHFESGEKIPNHLLEAYQRAKNFQEGWGLFGDARVALLDLAWHSADADQIEDIEAFEQNLFTAYKVSESVPGSVTSTNFIHIFAGGYAGGYYGYKWADMLVAHSQEHLFKHGLYEPGIWNRLSSGVFAKGGSEDAEDLFRKVTGSLATPASLLRRSGLTCVESVSPKK